MTRPFILATLRQPDKATAAALGVSLAAAGLDLATKALIEATFRLGETLPMTSFFNLVYWLNAGASFGFLSDAGGWQRMLLLALAVGISAWLLHEISRTGTPLGSKLAYALVLGGALGNVYDRVVRGAVVDWLDFHWGPYHWPAFNLADSAIVAGVGLLLLRGFLDRARPRIAPGDARRG